MYVPAMSPITDTAVLSVPQFRCVVRRLVPAAAIGKIEGSKIENLRPGSME